jgi:hypothetical protein
MLSPAPHKGAMSVTQWNNVPTDHDVYNDAVVLKRNYIIHDVARAP